MREKNIENKIKSYLKSKGAYYFKHHGNQYSQVGVPDIIACYKGRFIGIEVKNETGKTSPLQNYNLEAIQKAGGFSMVARDVDIVRELLEYLDKVI